VERFAAVLEQHCRAAPYNWFNFFDFWKPQVPPSPGRKVPHP
jgi:predicted LPLAT superfamily acyltransferase